MSPSSFRHKYKNVWVKMRDEKIWESAQQTLLAMEIGRNLNFDVISLCQKAGRKLAVLSSSVSETIQVYEFQTKANPYENIFLVSVWILSTQLGIS